jgi:hypothetical protein
MEHVLEAMRALEYQIGLEFPEVPLGGTDVMLKIFSNGQVFIYIPSDVVSQYGSVQICDGPPNDEMLRVPHSIRCWFENNELDFDAALKAVIHE